MNHPPHPTGAATMPTTYCGVTAAAYGRYLAGLARDAIADNMYGCGAARDWSDLHSYFDANELYEDVDRDLGLDGWDADGRLIDTYLTFLNAATEVAERITFPTATNK